MKQLTVRRITLKDPQDAAVQERVLNALPRHTIEETPWKAYPYKPTVQFAIAYYNSDLYIKYYVAEKNIRAVNTIVNSTVWEDSCVEFFIAFDEAGYYNLEFNCIGTALVGYGPSKTERNRLPAQIVEQINTRASITRWPGKPVQWELTIRIPLTTFIHHQPLALAGKQAKGNFYKCGDQLPEPHFVSWSIINTATPNFHVPADFGKLQFE